MQTILVIGSIFLFSILALSINGNMTEQYSDNYENEAVVTASSIGQSILETIQLKAYDENTVSSDVYNTSQLSTTLGTESGESSETLFDDIDDYDNYQSTIQMTRLDSFQVLVDVYYINQSNPDSAVTSPTFSKRIDVEINNTYLENQIRLYSIVSY